MTMLEADVWQLLLGAALAIAGGMFAELWREGRANRAEVRVLLGEVEGLLAVCDRMLSASQELSFSHFLPELRSYAREGAAGSRGWLRAVMDPDDRKAVLQVFSMASSAVGTVEAFVANENEAISDPNPARYPTLITLHRSIAQPGIMLLQHQARALLPRLSALEARPVLL